MAQPSTKQIQTYIDRLKPLMKLSDWEIEYRANAPTDEDAWAECAPVANGRAVVCFSPKLFQEPGSTQRMVFCHELNHCHFKRFNEIEIRVPRLQKELTEAQEAANDMMSRALAEFLPLPPWAK